MSLLAVAAISTQAWAQLTPSASVTTFTAVPGQSAYRAGESFRLLFEVSFKDGWHGQSSQPTLKSLIATRLTLASGAGITFGKVAYPKPVMEKFEFSKEPISTYKGTVHIGVTGAAPPDIAPGDYTVKATLRVQACDDKSCLPPSDLSVDVPVKIAAPGEAIDKLNEAVYAANERLFQARPAPGGGGMGHIGEYMETEGWFLTFVLIFLGGLALNLTPCVYPLIPVTVSYFGGSSDAGKGTLVPRAVLYLLGMAAMYSALGVTAALTGSLFGGMMQQPVVILFIVAVMVLLSLSMFGWYDIQPPQFLVEIGGKNREGFFGSFMMGLTAGIIAAPCIGPFVLGLLTFVGESGDPALGFFMFFTLALGLGLPFVALAIFSGAMTKLPRSGVWMVWIKKLFGFVLLGMGLYFMQPLVPEWAFLPLFGILILVAGAYLGFVTKVTGVGKVFHGFRLITALVCFAAGAFLIASAGPGSSGPSIQWSKATEAALKEAAASGAPVIIDFTADWCVPCKELEHYTFSDGLVVDRAGKFKTLKADFTVSGDPDAEALKKLYNVSGVPTVIFIGADGKEREELRFVGFIESKEFLDKMESALE